MSKVWPGNSTAKVSRSLNREIGHLREHHLKNRKNQPIFPQYQVARQKALLAVVTKIRESLDLETIFTTTAQEVRQLLEVDRVGMYRFDFDSRYCCGEFVSEAVVKPYSSTLAAKINDRCFGENFAEYYKKGRIWSCSDIYKVNLKDCHINILARFQVRANLVVPLLKGDDLWGLLCIHQCSHPRQWNQSEIEFVTQIAVHLGVALQQAEAMNQLQQQSEYLRQAVSKAVDREKTIATIIDKIRRSLDLGTIAATTTQEVRHLLNVDRVALFRFNEDWSGEFVYEAVGENWRPLMGVRGSATWGEIYLQDSVGGDWHHPQPTVVDDLNWAHLSPEHITLLAQFQARALCVVPVFVGESLWGLLGAYQNTGVRHWETEEINLLTQIGNQLGVAIYQADTLKKVQSQSQQLAASVEREKAIATIIDKIRRSLDLNTIFTTTVQEVRQLLKADRVTIYRFNPDWSGEFVVESVTPHWTSLLEAQQRDTSLCRNVSDCSLKSLGTVDTNLLSQDTHLRDTEGGAFTKGEIFRVVDDIYIQGFSECYLQALESYEARSYAIIAIYENQKLWGLLAAFQNDRPRQWQGTEINFLVQIGAQLGVAVQQAQLLEKTQRRSTELQSALTQQLQQRADDLIRSAERESAIAQIIDKIRLTLDLDTIFQTATREVRQLLEADRAAIYRFDPQSDYTEGEFISEDVLPQYGAALKAKICDRCFGLAAQRYAQNHIFSSHDIDIDDLEPCHRDILKRFNVRANLVVPLIQSDRLWGLLCIHQCDRPRHWQSREIEFVSKIAVHLGVALQQAELLKQAQHRSLELRATLADLNAIVDNLADGLLVTDVQGHITRFNPALLEMFGLENVDLKGQSLAQYFPPELVMLVKESERHEQEDVTADVKLGRDRFGQALATCVIKEADGDEGEQCLGSVILIRDVTVEREVDRMKTDFLATVSHELRTPLTSVLGFASIIKEKLEEKVFPQVQSRDRVIQKAMRTIGSNINIIIDEAERLTSLIDDVLDIAKMEAGRVDWHLEQADPKAILDRAIAATSSLFQDSELTLIEDCAPNLPQIRVDRDRLIQVLINLISNAVKFTQEGTVICSAFVSGQNLQIEVTDTGIGIAPEDQEKVFERFQQVGDVLTDKPKGTGLGLPICKQIIEYHGGRIWVNSQLSQGCTFAFTIPLLRQ